MPPPFRNSPVVFASRAPPLVGDLANQRGMAAEILHRVDQGVGHFPPLSGLDGDLGPFGGVPTYLGTSYLELDYLT